MINEQILERFLPITEEERLLLQGQDGICREIYMSPDSTTIDAARLMEAGKLLDIRAHTRFVHFPEHTHNYIEMVYMCRGETTHIANGQTIRLKEGELLLFGQGSRQEILPAGENDIAVNFIILPRFFDRVLEMLSGSESPLRRFIVDCLSNANGSSNCLYFQVADVLPVQNLIENLLWTVSYPLPNRRTICQTTMGLLFMQLINHTDRLTGESPEDAAILQVLRYIEENYRSASLQEISDELHYDFCRMSREIKRKTGRSYKELLQEKRLNQAAYLLTRTAMRVDDIADAVGYSNMSYFHRIFCSRYGMTPKRYRDSAD